eukprot:gene8215-5740_t
MSHLNAPTAADPAVQSVVIDVGSSFTKAGYAAEEAPRDVFHSWVGTPKHPNTRATLFRHPTDIVAGEDAYRDAGLLNTVQPVVKGHVVDFDALECLLFDTIYRRLHILPDNSPFLLLEPADQTRADREKLVEIMFESFNAPMLGLLNNSTATVYSTGRTTGVAVDSGAGKTMVNAVTEGYALEGAMRSSYIAGDVLTDELFHCLRRRGYPLSTQRDWRIVEHVKETICRAAIDLDEDRRILRDKGPEVSYSLPDNERIFLFEDLFMIPERLLDPHAMNRESGSEVDVNQWRPKSPTQYSLTNPSCEWTLKGWADTIEEVIALSPELIRDTLYENIVLGGGTSMMRDLEKRLQREMVMKTANVKNIMGEPRLVKCVAFEERAVAAWLGASIWGASPTYLQTTLKKSDYHEKGPSSIHMHRF